ncbi:MAG: hypothetical protein WAT66_15680 [Actinomycetota bacterium]
MSTAKKALYAAVGAGDLALEQAKGLPKRVTSLPTQIKDSAGEIRSLPSKAASLRKDGRERVTKVYKTFDKATTKSRKRATKTLNDLSKRGEKLVKRISKSAPTKRALEQTKAARSRVKAATTSVRKAVKADSKAVVAAAETVVEQAG